MKKQDTTTKEKTPVKKKPTTKTPQRKKAIPQKPEDTKKELATATDNLHKKAFRNDAAKLFISTAETEEPETEAKPAETSGTIPKGYKLVKENKSDRMQLLVRHTLKEEMKKEAAAQGISTNDLVNNIFEEYLGRKGRL